MYISNQNLWEITNEIYLKKHLNSIKELKISNTRNTKIIFNQVFYKHIQQANNQKEYESLQNVIMTKRTLQIWWGKVIEKKK